MLGLEAVEGGRSFVKALAFGGRTMQGLKLLCKGIQYCPLPNTDSDTHIFHLVGRLTFSATEVSVHGKFTESLSKVLDALRREALPEEATKHFRERSYVREGEWGSAQEGAMLGR